MATHEDHNLIGRILLIVGFFVDHSYEAQAVHQQFRVVRLVGTV